MTILQQMLNCTDQVLAVACDISILTSTGDISTGAHRRKVCMVVRAILQLLQHQVKHHGAINNCMVTLAL